MIRVLLADDQALVRTGFRMILSVQPDMTVGEADVVLMDYEAGLVATGEPS